jgi:Tol biopolymer transport system component
VDVLDLVTGRTRRLTPDVPDSVTATPVAWSPDGARLVIRVEVSTPNFRSVLGAVTLDDGRWTRWTEGPEQPVFGSPVAFARTGDRLAYQVGRVVTVAAPDGRKTSSFVLPNESWLAGKGAWTPDGRSLVLATRQAASTDWTLRAVDPTTGRDVAPLDLPQVSGVSAIRLLGWRPEGSALVVAYQPGPHVPVQFDDPMEIDQRTTYGNVRAIRILALTPGADTPSTVMTAPEQVLAVDVADDVISSGRTRDAGPPGGVGGRFWVWTTLIALVIAGVAAFRGRKRLARWFDGQR